MDVAENKSRDMRRIDLADNDFAVVPSSWILLGDGESSESFSQVSVVEICGGAKQGAPHFSFLHNGEYNEEDVLDLAIQKWPPLFDLAHDPCVGRWNSKSAKSCVYKGAPVICFYELQDASFYEGRGLDAPCGASVTVVSSDWVHLSSLVMINTVPAPDGMGALPHHRWVVD